MSQIDVKSAFPQVKLRNPKVLGLSSQFAGFFFFFFFCAPAGGHGKSAEVVEPSLWLPSSQRSLLQLLNRLMKQLVMTMDQFPIAESN